MNWTILLPFAGLAAVLVVATLALRAYLRARQTRIVTCPDNHRPAAVKLEATGALLHAVRGGEPSRLRDCSRWPEKQGCGQECVEQIEAAPADCLVRTILERAFIDRECALCGARFGPIHWHDHKPCLMDAEGKTAEWSTFAPETLPDVLASHKPVCWNCHIAETLRRRYPERVVDRDRRPGGQT